MSLGLERFELLERFEPGLDIAGPEGPEALDAEILDDEPVATPQMNEELQNQLNQPIGTMELSVGSTTFSAG